MVAVGLLWMLGQALASSGRGPRRVAAAQTRPVVASVTIDPEAPLPMRIAVVDARKVPVEGARLRVWNNDAARVAGAAPEGECSTDARGRAEISMSNARAVLVADRADAGSSVASDRLVLARQADREGLTVVTLISETTVRGRVRGVDDEPVPDALVELVELADGRRRQLRADARGEFAVRVVADEPVVLWAWDQGRRSPGERLLARADAERQVELRVAGDWWIAGVLKDAQGRPVKGARVACWRSFPGLDLEAHRLPEDEPEHVETVSDADGRFRIPVQRLGPYLLLASSPERAASDVVAVTLDAAHTRPDVTLQLPEPSFVAGRLVLPDGRALAGVEVVADPGRFFVSAQDFGPQALDRFGRARAVTDADGRFRLQPLHPRGVYTLSCVPDAEHPTRTLTAPDVKAGTADFVWTARPADLVHGVIAGLVLDSDSGSALTVFETELIERDAAGAVQRRRVLHQEDVAGKFRIADLKPGTSYGLIVRAEGRGAAEVPWWVAAESGRQIVVRLEPPALLQVEVLDEQGAPVPGCALSLEPRSELAAAGSIPPQRADERGRSLFEDLGAGAYRLTATHGELRQQTDVVLRGGSVTQARLELHGL